MHDVVIDALGRIDAAEEAAAFDRGKVKYGRWGPSPWTIDSEIIGAVRQGDIPQLISDELAKACLIPGGIKAITTALNLATSKSLKDYASGTYKMPYSTGQRFVRYLEQQAQKSGAASAGTETAPETQTTTGASEDIVPQEVEKMATLAEEQHNELQNMMEQISRERDALRERVADLELIRDLVKRMLAVNAC